jgi:hypothetical protein
MKSTGETMEEGEMSSLYGDETPSKGENKSVDEEAREESANTDVIKTSVLQSGPDDKVAEGDERVVKVLEVYGDTCKVMYAPKEERDPSMHEQSPDDELEEMDKPDNY